MILENFHCLGEISVKDFLDNYWQKKPLLIRNAFPDIQSPLTADELAGLACEENVNARLVLEKDGDYPWQAEFGPFEESRFGDLPETHWSLLVSDVERQIPETKSLVKPFRFLPDWRLDDLMISYAPEGGSVGAHVDDYDVFLIQLSGQRLWKISEHFTNDTIDDVDLRILKDFTAEQEWLCNPGDLLYLPPNVAHHGIAQASKNEKGDEEHCMTASVGFRAPSLKTITSDYVNFLNENIHTAARYTDKSPAKPEHHAEISEDTVSQFIECLQQGLTLEPEQVKRWLGQYRSDNKAFEDSSKANLESLHDIGSDELTTLAARSALTLSPYSNFLFSYHNQAALLFVDGLTYEVSSQFAERLCEDDQINFQQLQSVMTADDEKVFLTLFNDGSIITLDNS
ncbi:MAG: cupin domain-containing protein [Gammaproteobacteria bacterium]|nr:cupin domain-containing protein [Gammaproteobacteria bacterium]